MKTIYTFLLLCIITFANSKLLAQTSFYSQNFEVTNDWTISPSTISNNNNYLVYSTSGGNTNSGVRALQVWARASGSWSASYGNNSTSQYTLTATKTFDLSTLAGATISFNYYVMCNGEASYDDLIVTVNGTTYDGPITGITAFTQRTINLSSFAGNSSVIVAFKWRNDGNTANQPGARIDDISITYSVVAPTVTTTTATSITSTTASSGGNVTSTGGASVTEKGVCYGTSTSPTIAGTKTSDGTGTGIFSSSITGLSAQTLYYYRAYATNSVGTSYGSESSFYTLATEPTGHSAAFTATAANPNQINVSFSAASGYGADGYLILGYAGASAPSSSGVVDGIAYNAFSLVSPVTVITQITNSSATSYSHTALLSNTQYYYKIIPYNWDLTNPSTYNYLTAVTIPSATATTPTGPAVEGMYIAGDLTNDGTIISTNDDNYMRMTGTSKTLSGTGTFTNTKYCVDGTITFTGTFAAGAMLETFVNTSKSINVSDGKIFKNGLLTNYGTVTLTGTFGTGIWENTGDYINYSTFTTAASSLLKFNGTSAQTITELTPSTFSNVTIDNASGVSMLSDVTVANTLTLTNGKFIVGGNKTLYIGSASANGIITGGSSYRYIVAYDNGTTIGKLQRAINTATSTDYVFPIGDLSSYAPVNYTLVSGTLSSANLSVYTKPVRISAMNIGLQTYLNRYWEVTSTGISGSTYNISYNYADGDINSGGTEANLLPVKLSGGVWYRPTESSFQTGVIQGSGSVTANSNLLTWTGLTTYSAFGGAGNEAVVLPVDLVLFTGACVDRKNILKWESFTEMNNDYYTIENTIDGISFEEIGTVDGAGNTSEINAYEMVHENYRNAINYYRLKQTDFDGSSKYSELISIDNRSGANEKEIVSITNLLGQEINENYKGLVIVTFTDGSSVKRIQ